MRKWTFAVLFACWGSLSAVTWWLSEGAIDQWVAQNLAERVDPSQVNVIAAVSANLLPFIGAAVLMLALFGLAQPMRPATAARPPAPQRGAASSHSKIYIKPPKTLVHAGARFGVVLRNGDAANEPSAGRDEIYFRSLDDRGILIAQVPRNDVRQPEIRYFVDYKGLKFERVKRALAASRFTLLSRQQDKTFRAWFLPSGGALVNAGAPRADLRYRPR
jgi:hypothetical protein